MKHERPPKHSREQVIKAIEVSAATAALVGVAYYVVRHREEAQDAAQDAYLKALKAAGRFRGDSQPDTWLHRIGINAAKDRRSYNQSRQAESLESLGERVGLELDEPDSSLDPEEYLMRMETLREIKQAMIGMPEIQREIFIRADFYDQPQKQIMEELDLPEGTVKAYLSRARDYIAANLANQKSDP